MKSEYKRLSSKIPKKSLVTPGIQGIRLSGTDLESRFNYNFSFIGFKFIRQNSLVNKFTRVSCGIFYFVLIFKSIRFLQINLLFLMDLYTILFSGVPLVYLFSKLSGGRTNQFAFNLISLFIYIAILSYPLFVHASKNLPVPRFVTTKFDEVNVRTGPDKDCPIEWIFVKKFEPVEVVAEYEQWRKIRDINGDGGWVHSSLLSKNRAVVITANNTIPLFSSPPYYKSDDDIFSDLNEESKQHKIVAKLKPGLRCMLQKCTKEWCKLNCRSYNGWVLRKLIWGVYPEE